MPDTIEAIGAIDASATGKDPTTVTQFPNPSPRPAQPPVLPPDTVALSETAKVQLLQKQGQSVQQIAQSLGLPVDEVMKALGVASAAAQASSTQQTGESSPS